METQIAQSDLGTELSAVANIDLHKAWHLLSLLLEIGRPARPRELTFRCTLFPASPDFVQFLCSIPNSPLLLTNDLFVTPSLAALVAFGQFITNSNIVPRFFPQVELQGFGPKRLWEDVKTYYRIRKRVRSDSKYMPVAKRGVFLDNVDVEEEDRIMIEVTSDTRSKIFCIDNTVNRDIRPQPSDKAGRKETVMVRTSLHNNCNTGLLGYEFNNTEKENEKEADLFVNMKEFGFVCTPWCQHEFLNHERFSHIASPMRVESMMSHLPHPEPLLLNGATENPVLSGEAKMDYTDSQRKINLRETSCLEEEKWMLISSVAAENAIPDCTAANVKSFKDERAMEQNMNQQLIDSDNHERDSENLPSDSTKMVASPADDITGKITVRCNSSLLFLGREKVREYDESQTNIARDCFSIGQKQQTKSSVKLETFHKDSANPQVQALGGILGNSSPVDAPIDQQQCKKDKKSISMKKKSKKKSDQNKYIREMGENSKENRLKQKELPYFESFIVEEEEGSGGYGTVYRAQRKNDGATVAIKCPHANANRHHVHNELKMLERFGGKNFVIKFEGSFKNGNSDCLVLEHVDHDRPEILKREIDVFQLQWYGYCMFRALAGLHKQGIVHRDVKPGNFLFSRKVNKGYLIDFNLAMDLHQKNGSADKSKVGCDVTFNHAPIRHTKSLPPSKSRKFPTTKVLEAVDLDGGKGSKSTLLPKNVKRKTDQGKACNDLSNRNMVKSQCADGSGITSAKDATSTITPSADRLREPMPCQGRKELISLVQKAMHSPNQEAVRVPALKRKRVAAPPGKVDRKLFYLTPMPLHSTGIVVAGAAILKNKGDGKHKKEGPCVGTKGFRAPEVLFRSLYQGPKVDIWSAGVTLLYLMIGRTPFTGDPDQNIKEIAKLRGSEDLWEVAKLHNQESSFPVELRDIRSLPSAKLQDWCKFSTRRPDFLEATPISFLDLVDKCLTVNPRLRISAEEALRHEFFAPCHEALRKQRLLRQGLSMDSGTSQLLHGQS